MKLALIILFAAIGLTVIAVNVWAGMQVNLFDAWPDFQRNPWAIATLVDAYAGFLTFYVWVLYRERSLVARLLWFVLIMGLGNITMSLYVLLALWSLPRGASLTRLMERRPA